MSIKTVVYNFELIPRKFFSTLLHSFSEMMSQSAERLNVYLDLNVYSRPFDDQTKEKIRRETEAINVIWDQVKKGAIRLVSSDVLYLEVKKILSESKRAKVKEIQSLMSGNIGERLPFTTFTSRFFKPRQMVS